jgi:PAS domain-containing protein
MPVSLPDPVFLAAQSALLLQTYERLLARPLLVDVPAEQQVQALYHAPFALVSHTPVADPIFNYANATALQLFEYRWDEFIQIPSRLSAEPINQTAREHLLSRVRQEGYIQDYEGIRISKTGRRFMIQCAVVWNLYDAQQVYRGQAACFNTWQYV